MATLDDKLLGEKLHYYCSSSEDEEEPVQGPPPPPSDPDPSTGNTGPKGVLKDWRRYKQLETEKRDEAEIEKLALAKKLNLSCKSEREEREEKEREKKIEEELQELMEDDFMQEYMQRRMQEMMDHSNTRKKFGRVFDLRSGEEFLSAVDQEEKTCTVIVLLHEPGVQGCQNMLGCIKCLAQDYPTIKFCQILGSAAGLSKHFKVSGVPALLIYREGQLVANFIRLTDQLGEDFNSHDVESFLTEHSLLPNKEDVPRIIRSSAIHDTSDSD